MNDTDALDSLDTRMTVPAETCEACRFDGAQYDLPDALGTLRALPVMWDELLEGVPEHVRLARPATEVWSAAEYAAHSADVGEAMGRLLHGILVVDGLVLEEEPEPRAPDVSGGSAASLERLAANLGRLHDKAAQLPEGDVRWDRFATVAGHRLDAAWVVRHAVHDVAHHLMDAGRGIHLLGAGAPAQEGTVAQLNVSGGGVPKRPVEAAEVGDRGLLGDRQADRKHHGRPLQALCLWSADVIEALQAEGHPIEPGAAGENITVAGIDWTTLRPGVQLLVGDVLVEISAWATPCAKNARWFADRDFHRIDHDRHPGWSRAYAWVREPGTIRTGDAVIVEP